MLRLHPAANDDDSDGASAELRKSMRLFLARDALNMAGLPDDQDTAKKVGKVRAAGALILPKGLLTRSLYHARQLSPYCMTCFCLCSLTIVGLQSALSTLTRKACELCVVPDTSCSCCNNVCAFQVSNQLKKASALAPGSVNLSKPWQNLIKSLAELDGMPACMNLDKQGAEAKFVPLAT